ncbi:MAG: thioredoxin family protein [Desulfuromonadales bacterium]|nr:thioredoxin family protein [Desulfuromonadales bacterium]
MNRNMKATCYLTLLAAALGGCASGGNRIIAAGDGVGIHFTCRLPNGELALSTDPDAEKSAPSSRIYQKRVSAEPLIVVAGGAKMNKPVQERMMLEDDVAERLAIALVGIREDGTVRTELTADRYAVQPDSKPIVKIAKVRKRPKEQRMTLAEYKTRTGMDAATDQKYVTDPVVPGKVVAITGDEVLIRFAPAVMEIDLPFGKGLIREKEDRYEIDIQAVPGTLVRTGNMIGRIVSVDDEMITLDYGHPFGGEKLSCEVQVKSLKTAEKKVIEPQSVPANVARGELDPQAEKVFDEGMAKMLSMTAQAAGATAAARSGDLVTVNYTVALEDGTLVATTQEKIARDQAVKKVSWYREPGGYGPQELVAGKPEIMPGLAEALVGMKAGEKRRITLAPDKAFGMPDPKKTQQLPCSQAFPTTIRMPADEYVKRFSTFPVVNKEVELLPYFKSRVAEVTERDVALEFQVKDGAQFTDTYGTVSVAVAKDTITTTLKPKLGAPFPLKDGEGVISATDGITFTVDMNHPLAGKSIVLDLETVSVATPPQGASIDWIEDHDAGLARAKQEGKPVLLILHADWCSWCKKTFSDVIPDPRIAALRDRFVWVRVNSDKEAKYKQKYAQNGFPMIVLFKGDGSEARRMEGFQSVTALRSMMRELL